MCAKTSIDIPRIHYGGTTVHVFHLPSARLAPASPHAPGDRLVTSTLNFHHNLAPSHLVVGRRKITTGVSKGSSPTK